MSIGYIPKKLKYRRKRRRSRKKLRRSYKRLDRTDVTKNFNENVKKKPTFLERLRAFFH